MKRIVNSMSVIIGDIKSDEIQKSLKLCMIMLHREISETQFVNIFDLLMI